MAKKKQAKKKVTKKKKKVTKKKVTKKKVSKKKVGKVSSSGSKKKTVKKKTTAKKPVSRKPRSRRDTGSATDASDATVTDKQLLTLLKNIGKDRAGEIIRATGAKKFSDIPKSKYGEVLAMINNGGAVTLDRLRTLAEHAVAKVGAGTVAKFIKQLSGVTKLSDIPAEDYVETAAQLEAWANG